MYSRKWVSVTALAAGAVSAVAVAGVAVGQSPSMPTVQHFDHVANAGVALDRAAVSAEDARILNESGGQLPLRALGKRAGVGFYVAAGRNGGLCYAVGVGLGNLMGLACPSARAMTADVFPSDSHPITDFSPRATDPGSGRTRVLALLGFAADGIAKVGVIDTDGALRTTSVSENVYYAAPLPDVAAGAIVALDNDGREVYRLPIGD